MYNFYIEENEVQVIFSEDYKQFTFEVKRDNTSENILENYICKVYNNGEIEQFIVSYPLTENNGVTSYNGENSVIQIIQDVEVIINARGFPPGCVPQLVSESWTYECVSIPCTGKDHEYGDDDCNCGNPNSNCIPASQECGWAVSFVYKCGGGYAGDPITPGGDGGLSSGNGGTNNNPDPKVELLTVPFKNKNHIKNCIELSLNEQSQDFKDKVADLKTKINGGTEYTLGIYNGSYSSNTSLPNPICGTLQPGTSQNTASIPYNPALKAIAHNHLKDTIHNQIGTFTPRDLIQLAELVKNGQQYNSQVKQEEYASYLFCNEGSYAIKLSNFEKLLAFAIKYTFNDNFKERIDKFYIDNNIVHGEDKDLQNISFLQLIAKFDIGIDYYQADDAMGNWEKLELNQEKNGVKNIPCN